MEQRTNFVQRLWHAGTQPTQTNYLNRKIVITNQIAWLQTIMSGSYMLSLWVSLPVLGWISTTFFLTNILILWFNYARFTSLSRIILAIYPSVEAALYHGMAVNADDPLSTPLYMNFMLACLYPFMVFGWRERWMLLLTALVGAIGFLAFPAYADLIPKLLTPQDIAQNKETETSVYVTVILSMYVMMTIQLFDNYKATKMHSELREQSEAQNQEMAKSQAQLNETFRELEQKRRQEKQQGQISYWLTQINDILHTASHATDVYSRLISQIVEALEVNQGGIYSVNYESQEDIYIELTASYAYERQKFEVQRIELGEGLLGQSYLEKEKVLLTDIPPNYTKITSGLGAATPAFLAIIPLKINENIEGFIEMASFERLEDFKIEFLERAGESIASFMTSEKAQRRTQKLLEQSQRQAEELRLKEEEMRQNVEELRATQEKIEQKEREYIQQIKALQKELKSLQK